MLGCSLVTMNSETRRGCSWPSSLFSTVNQLCVKIPSTSTQITFFLVLVFSVNVVAVYEFQVLRKFSGDWLSFTFVKERNTHVGRIIHLALDGMPVKFFKESLV